MINTWLDSNLSNKPKLKPYKKLKTKLVFFFRLLYTHQKTRMVVVLRITYIIIKVDRRVIRTVNRVKSALSCIHKAQPGVSRIIEMLVISYLVFVAVPIVPALGGEHNMNSVYAPFIPASM